MKTMTKETDVNLEAMVKATGVILIIPEKA
jgi:hypothetical protein